MAISLIQKAAFVASGTNSTFLAQTPPWKGYFSLLLRISAPIPSPALIHYWNLNHNQAPSNFKKYNILFCFCSTENPVRTAIVKTWSTDEGNCLLRGCKELSPGVPSTEAFLKHLEVCKTQACDLWMQFDDQGIQPSFVNADFRGEKHRAWAIYILNIYNRTVLFDQ